MLCSFLCPVVDGVYSLPLPPVLPRNNWCIALYKLKVWCFWTVVLEKTLKSPLDCKEIQPVNPKGNQPWIFIAKTDAEAEAPILWPPDAKSWLIGKDPDAGKDWRWEERGTTEDEMVGWHHQFSGHKFEHGRWWGTGKPGMLQSMGSQRVGHDSVTKQQQKIFKTYNVSI